MPDRKTKPAWFTAPKPFLEWDDDDPEEGPEWKRAREVGVAHYAEHRAVGEPSQITVSRYLDDRRIVVACLRCKMVIDQADPGRSAPRAKTAVATMIEKERELEQVRKDAQIQREVAARAIDEAREHCACARCAVRRAPDGPARRSAIALLDAVDRLGFLVESRAWSTSRSVSMRFDPPIHRQDRRVLSIYFDGGTGAPQVVGMRLSPENWLGDVLGEVDRFDLADQRDRKSGSPDRPAAPHPPACILNPRT